jgi:tetratricopeptide (TPR) repeat protein
VNEPSLEDQEQRLASLQEMLGEDPTSSFLRYGVAMQLKGLGRAAEALSEYQRLVDEHPDYVPTYYHYAALLGEEGREEEGVALARRGVERAEAAGNGHAKAELLDLIDELDG